MNCKFAGQKQGFGDMPQQAKSPARQGWPGQGFAGSVATLPMLATLLRQLLFSTR